MNTLSYDILFEICSYMPPIQAYSLRITNKFLSEIITLETIAKLLVNKVKERLLVVMGDDYNEFIKIIDEFQYILTGSFVLRQLIGIEPGEWNNPFSDIDLFCTKTDKLIIRNRLKSEILDEWYNHDGSLYNLSYDGDKIQHLCPVISYGNRQKLDFIFTTVSDFDKLIKFIEFSFDFGMCRNMVYIKNGKFYVKLYNLDNAFERRISLEGRPIYHNTIQRYRKYRSRGFDIFPDNINEMTELCSGFIEFYKTKLLGRDYYHKICQLENDILKEKGYIIPNYGRGTFIITDNNMLVYGGKDSDITLECDDLCPLTLFEDFPDHDHLQLALYNQDEYTYNQNGYIYKNIIIIYE